MANPATSIIVSTYNRPDALRKCVESIFRQRTLPNEIVIADDGSGKETERLVNELKAMSPVKLIHVWQEDEGYQLARIRNRSFAAASGPYLIQIDGDLVLEKHFVHDHLAMAKAGTFVAGARAMMNAELTGMVLRGDVTEEQIHSYTRHIGLRSNIIRSSMLSRIVYVYQRHKRNYKYVFGCNMAFWKKDILMVNGYDESFKGWGKEDNELTVRLQNAGIKLRFIKFGAVAYHLYHKVADLSFSAKNEEKLNETIQKGVTFAPSGIRNYLQDQKN
jgi:glycosyltransferase involved in cell wall biosynthesis